jgi:hypothetical protein
LASSRLGERSGFMFWKKTDALTGPRRHGETTEADGYAFLRVSASLRENEGFGR